MSDGAFKWLNTRTNNFNLKPDGIPNLLNSVAGNVIRLAYGGADQVQVPNGH